MRIPTIVAAAAITLAVMTLCACSVVSLAHGDPGRATGTAAPAPTATSAAPAADAVPGAPLSATASDSTVVVSAAAPPAAAGAVSAVTVTFSDHMQELAAADPRLTTDAVAGAIESELRAHQLYTPGNASVHRTLAIRVEDFSSQLSSNATLFGYTFRNLMLIGTVQVQGDAAVGQTPFDVHARANQSNRDPGAGAGSLTGLYTRFAALTVADLRGVEPPSEQLPR
jgi:hypothetical protein